MSRFLNMFLRVSFVLNAASSLYWYEGGDVQRAAYEAVWAAIALLCAIDLKEG